MRTMQFFISTEEKGKYLMCLCDICSASRWMFIRLGYLELHTHKISMAENPIYSMAPVIFYWQHIPDARENNCGVVFSLNIKLFGANTDGFSFVEPSGNLLAAYLKFSWFLVMCFVCQFVYHRTSTVLWRTRHNIIEFFS